MESLRLCSNVAVVYNKFAQSLLTAHMVAELPSVINECKTLCSLVAVFKHTKHSSCYKRQKTAVLS